MRKLFYFGLALAAVAFVGAPTMAQTNFDGHHNGIEYFFFNPITPPTNTTTVTRAYASASSIGNESGGAEGNVHQLGAQQDGFEAWNGQAGLGPGSGSFPLGFSLMGMRRGTSFAQANGTFVAAASWVTSLPCSAPWFWIVTFGWSTAFTQTASSGPAQTFYSHIRGETSQTIANQNYFTGSGNERNLNTGGISFIEDTGLGTAFQLIGRQEWSTGIYSADGKNVFGRDPSGTAAGFGVDYGTGGMTLRTASTATNPGNPKDAAKIRHRANQNLLGIPVVMQSLLTSPTTPGPGGLTTSNPAGNLALPAFDGRTTNVTPDAILTGLGLGLAILTKTGGALGGLTGDVGLSGTAHTITTPLGGVGVPPALSPITVQAQAISITAGLFGPISVGDGTSID